MNCKQSKLKSTEQTEIKVIQFTPNFSQGIKGKSEKEPFVGAITMVSTNTPFLSLEVWCHVPVIKCLACLFLSPYFFFPAEFLLVV